MTHIMVLGAGYTGMMAAIRVAVKTRRQGVRVTLVNASPRFTERLRMHQTAAGQRLTCHSIEKVIAGTGITFLRDRVTGLDPGRHEVTLQSGRVARFDKLIYALGTVTDRSTPGVSEHAHVYDDHDGAVRLADALNRLTEGTVVVAGGGLTGVESVTEIAEAHPHLRVVLLSRGTPAAMMGDSARAYVLRAMDRLGIEVRAGAEVEKVLPDAVALAGGELIESSVTLWTAGTTGLPLARESGLAVDGRGRVVVDATLRSVSHPDVYAVGDAAAVRQSYGVIHGTCQSGIPTALHAADVIAARLRGGRARPFRFGYFHQPLSLGRGDAVIQFTRNDDSPRRAYLTGRWAIVYKEAVTRSPLPGMALLKRGLVPARAFRVSNG